MPGLSRCKVLLRGRHVGTVAAGEVSGRRVVSYNYHLEGKYGGEGGEGREGGEGGEGKEGGEEKEEREKRVERVERVEREERMESGDTHQLVRAATATIWHSHTKLTPEASERSEGTFASSMSVELPKPSTWNGREERRGERRGGARRSEGEEDKEEKDHALDKWFNQSAPHTPCTSYAKINTHLIRED
jgi:hypothetical protein